MQVVPLNSISLKTDIYEVKQLNNNRIGAADSQGFIYIYKVNDGQYTLTHSFQAHQAAIWSLDFSNPRFGNILISASFDKTVAVWKESKENEWHRIYQNFDHKGSVNKVQFSNYQHGLIYASAGNDGLIVVTDIISGYSESIQAHQQPVQAISWQPFDPISQSQTQVLVTGGNDMFIKLWRRSNSNSDFQLHQEVQLQGLNIRDLKFNPAPLQNHNLLATLTEDGQVYLLTVDQNEKITITQKLKNQEGGWRCDWAFTGDVLMISTVNNKAVQYQLNEEDALTLID